MDELNFTSSIRKLVFKLERLSFDYKYFKNSKKGILILFSTNFSKFSKLIELISNKPFKNINCYFSNCKKKILFYEPIIGMHKRNFFFATFGKPQQYRLNSIFDENIYVGKKYKNLFSVLGPEGVGKTTLCKNLEKEFKFFPNSFIQFHHTGILKKTKVNSDLRNYQIKNERSKKKGIKKILSYILPNFIKIQISAFIGEMKYYFYLKKIITNNLKLSSIVLTDRYCYDRLIRWINLKKPKFQIYASRIICYISKYPQKVFVLCDSPQNIYARKKVMPIWEIKKHQLDLLNFCHKKKINFEKITVSQFNEVDLKNLVARKIICELKNNIFNGLIL